MPAAACCAARWTGPAPGRADRPACGGAAGHRPPAPARSGGLHRRRAGAERDLPGRPRVAADDARAQPARRDPGGPARHRAERTAALRRRQAHPHAGREHGPGGGAARAAGLPRTPAEAALWRPAPVHHADRHGRPGRRAPGPGRGALERGGRLLRHPGRAGVRAPVPRPCAAHGAGRRGAGRHGAAAEFRHRCAGRAGRRVR
jgi:hypothetical protein